jgi:hypothetical protein
MKMLTRLLPKGEGLGIIAIIGNSVVCLCLLGNMLTPKPVVFKNLREFIQFAERNHFFLAPPTGIQNNTFATDHPFGADELREVAKLGKRNCGLTPVWRGAVWACQISFHGSLLEIATIDGKLRIWGNVLVAGDEEVMDRIVRLYHEE